MAKIKLGAIVVDMRGKLGGHVFAQNKGGNYVRTKVTPVNPQTVAQTAIRVAFAAISSGWSQLSQDARASFDSLVSAYAKTNVFGDLKNPSGKALYQRLNQNLSNSGQALITTCVNPEPVNVATIDTVVGTVGTQSMTFHTMAGSVGQKCVIYGTPPMSQGTTFVKNKLRQIYVGVGSEDASYVMGAAYVARFGAFALNDNIVLAIRTINANGQASPLATVKITISA